MKALAASLWKYTLCFSCREQLKLDLDLQVVWLAMFLFCTGEHIGFFSNIREMFSYESFLKNIFVKTLL